MSSLGDALTVVKKEPVGAFGANTGAFGANTGGIGAFGAQNASTGAFGASNTGASAFGGNTASTGAFGSSNAVATGAFGSNTSSSGAFGAKPAAGAFGGNAFGAAGSTKTAADIANVEVEDMPPNFLEVFKAEFFTPGKIPDVAPPSQLCQ